MSKNVHHDMTSKPPARSIQQALWYSSLFILGILPLLYFGNSPLSHAAASAWMLNVAFALAPVAHCSARLYLKCILVLFVGGTIITLTAISTRVHGYGGTAISDIWLFIYFLYASALAIISFTSTAKYKRR